MHQKFTYAVQLLYLPAETAALLGLARSSAPTQGIMLAVDVGQGSIREVNPLEFPSSGASPLTGAGWGPIAALLLACVLLQTNA
jgi:hypothetical protein